MYHLELRKFPHTVCRFNQSEAQVAAILVPWVKQEWFEEGEQKWNSNEATLTVLEGPKLSMPELAMGRGWRNAQRRSENVTERVLAAVSQGSGGGAPGTPTVAAGEPTEGEGRAAETAASPASGASADPQLLADSLALELLGMVDGAPVALAQAWRLAAERLGDASAADALSLGEAAVRSLIGRGLVVLCQPRAPGADADAPGAATAWQDVPGDRVEAALRAVDSWADGAPGALQIARKG
ncbi:MAG TPA: hypothetical protein VH025_00535 [Solirubrobacteraceae bacterium]|nr:hypothetical protein [Solirubrobacteraceae bacterium]